MHETLIQKAGAPPPLINSRLELVLTSFEETILQIEIKIHCKTKTISLYELNDQMILTLYLKRTVYVSWKL